MLSHSRSRKGVRLSELRRSTSRYLSISGCGENMSAYRSRIPLLIAALCCCLAIVELMFTPATQAIYTGEPFIYWSYVNRLARLPLALLGLVLLSVWIFTRRVWSIIAIWKPVAVLLFVCACSIGTLLTPLVSAPQTATHMQSVRTGGAHYHLYFEYAGLGAPNCQHVVVRCNALGLRCTYLEHFEIAPVCLAERASIKLSGTDQQLRVIINGEIVAVFEEPS